MELATAVADQPVDDAVRAGIVDELVRARAQVHAGEVTQVWMAAQLALAHPAEVDADGVVRDYAGWGEQRLSLSPRPVRWCRWPAPVRRWSTRVHRSSSVRR